MYSETLISTYQSIQCHNPEAHNMYIKLYCRGIGVRFLAGARDFLLSTASRSAVVPTLPPIQCLPVALSRGVMRPGRETTRVHLVPKLRIHVSIPPLPHTYSWRGT
jgi:hypothetical protein